MTSLHLASLKTHKNPKKPISRSLSDAGLPPIKWREPIMTGFLSLLAIVMTITARGKSQFGFNNATSWFSIPTWSFSSIILCAIMTVITLAFTAWIWKKAYQRLPIKGWLVVIIVLAFIVCFLSWVMGGNTRVFPIIRLLSGGLSFSIPLVLGAMSGALCERTGVINIAIEGQLLGGAFLAILVANAAGSIWLGLLGAPIAGVLIAVLLALFTINLRTDHIIVGVVLNMLILGLTNFLYSTLFVQKSYLNTPVSLPKWKIPVLGDIPIIGPVFFHQSILVYLMYIIVIALQFGFFHTRWGLRSRACGEHPLAADTVGIKVNYRRWMNVLLGGAVAGLGGAFFTLDSGLAFIENTSAGNGFIALAAMILGAWNPLGALAAALLFGLTTQLGSLMMTLGSPIPSEYLLMVPYIITILAVAGFVGAVRPPAMEGKPYPI